LNNSLTVITLQSQLLARLDAASPRFGEHLAILQDQVAHMKRIVRELQVSSDFNGPKFEATDINALVQRTLDIQAFQLQQADVQVKPDLVPDLPQVQADPHRLEQVFVNLLKNACQALTDADRPRLLWVSTRSGVGRNGCLPGIRICFANNGPASPRHLLPRIFEPFFTTKEPGQGTGLGLTICARIVREHGGRIWAESGASNGALFVVELPIEPAAETGPRRTPAASAPEATLSVTSRTAATGLPNLVVEDEADTVRPVEPLLR
jgi:signal transduction histidine kinase